MPEPVVDDPGPGPAGASAADASVGVPEPAAGPSDASGRDAAAPDAAPDAAAAAAYGAAPAVAGAAAGAAVPPDAAGSGGLRVEGLSVVYPAGRGSDPVRAVDDVDLTLPRGRILALLGPSGCGKSSLLRAVAGLEEIAAGTIAWDGADVVGVPVHKRGFGLMFQDGQLFPFRDVAGNVAYGLVRLPRARRRERVAEMLELVGLPGYGGRDVTTLSGGQAQRVALARSLGCHVEELDIRPAAEQMLTAMDHPYGRGERGREVYDVTFENVQAGLRTDLLFRIAGRRGGIVLGTGDLSELALGWCTFGVGDQMAHYGVNAGIPKTLIQHLIRWVVAERLFPDDVGHVLLAILGTEISPELVPAGEGEPIQSTQARIGPYALQDFTLWHVLRRGSRPSRIAFLAERAWADPSAGAWPPGLPEEERVAYDLAAIRKWELVFFRRFFSNQFKRSTLPNGPKVVAGGSLSPRGDWRMPSDASGAAWIAELERNVPEA